MNSQSVTFKGSLQASVTVRKCSVIVLIGEAGDFTGIELTRMNYVPVLDPTLTKRWIQELPLETFLVIAFVPWLAETLNLRVLRLLFPNQQGVRHILHFP